MEQTSKQRTTTFVTNNMKTSSAPNRFQVQVYFPLTVLLEEVLDAASELLHSLVLWSTKVSVNSELDKGKKISRHELRKRYHPICFFPFLPLTLAASMTGRSTETLSALMPVHQAKERK